MRRAQDRARSARFRKNGALFFRTFITKCTVENRPKNSFFFTIRCHFPSFENFRKRISRTKANTLLIKTVYQNFMNYSSAYL